MSEELKKLILNFGIDVEDELDVSPFDYDYTFRWREYLAKEYELLDSSDKEKLKYYDTILINRSKEFYEYLKPLKMWWNNTTPIKYWWWHLDKVISRELKVDIKMNEIKYNGEVIK